MASEIEAAAVAVAESKVEEGDESRPWAKTNCQSHPVHSRSSAVAETGDEADKRAAGAAFDAASVTVASAAGYDVRAEGRPNGSVFSVLRRRRKKDRSFPLEAKRHTLLRTNRAGPSVQQVAALRKTVNNNGPRRNVRGISSRVKNWL